VQEAGAKAGRRTNRGPIWPLFHRAAKSICILVISGGRTAAPGPRRTLRSCGAQRVSWREGGKTRRRGSWKASSPSAMPVLAGAGRGALGAAAALVVGARGNAYSLEPVHPVYYSPHTVRAKGGRACPGVVLLRIAVNFWNV